MCDVLVSYKNVSQNSTFGNDYAGVSSVLVNSKEVLLEILVNCFDVCYCFFCLFSIFDTQYPPEGPKS